MLVICVMFHCIIIYLGVDLFEDYEYEAHYRKDISVNAA